MRVTIEHREEASGLAGQRRTYYVDCTVHFSEEERAIIKARDLYAHDITVRAATPLPTETAVAGSGFLRATGALLATTGPIVGIVGAVTKSGGEGLGYLMFFGGLGMAIYGRRRAHIQENRLLQPQQSVSVRQILSASQFTVHALDPAHAKAIEEDIRAALVALKETIKQSAQLQAKQTFEL